MIRRDSRGKRPAGRIGDTFRSCRGLSLVELLVALALGTLITLVATASLVSAKSFYVTQDETDQLQETGQFAMEAVVRAVRQVGYQHWDRQGAALVGLADLTPAVSGLDSCSLKESSPGIEAPFARSVNGSDVLALRFFGAGDGAMLNCAGFAVAEAVDPEADRGWSIFYVAADRAGEPELRCKYRGKAGWNTDAIARGIESFQVLYGVDTDDDGLPNRYFTATGIDALDSALGLAGGSNDWKRRTAWKKIVSIRFALLVRGTRMAEPGQPLRRHDLFGQAYSDLYAAADAGTRIDEASLPLASRNRMRKIFTATVQLDKQYADSAP